MRRRFLTGFVLLAALAVTPAGMAADPPRAHVSRKPPIYPELAKKMHIRGQVQVQITVLPDGSVIRAKAVDGHPLLQAEAERAIMGWRFAPAPKESTFLVGIVFKLDQ